MLRTSSGVGGSGPRILGSKGALIDSGPQRGDGAEEPAEDELDWVEPIGTRNSLLGGSQLPSIDAIRDRAIVM